MRTQKFVAIQRLNALLKTGLLWKESKSTKSKFNVIEFLLKSVYLTRNNDFCWAN